MKAQRKRIDYADAKVLFFIKLMHNGCMQLPHQEFIQPSLQQQPFVAAWGKAEGNYTQ